MLMGILLGSAMHMDLYCLDTREYDLLRKLMAKQHCNETTWCFPDPCLMLRQCDHHDPTVEKAIITLLLIAMDNHTIEVNAGKPPYNSCQWLAIGLINWTSYDMFLEQEMVFLQLTNTEQTFNASTGAYTEQVAELAETSDDFHLLHESFLK